MGNSVLNTSMEEDPAHSGVEVKEGEIAQDGGSVHNGLDQFELRPDGIAHGDFPYADAIGHVCAVELKIVNAQVKDVRKILGRKSGGPGFGFMEREANFLGFGDDGRYGDGKI